MLPVFKRTTLVLGFIFLLLFVQFGLVFNNSIFNSVAFADDKKVIKKKIRKKITIKKLMER
jgi:hypothetical protein